MAAGHAVGAIILAAGRSSRLGQPKQLLEFGGQTLLRRAIDAALEAGCAPVVVVVGAGADEMQAQIPSSQVRVTLNENWRDGMSTSVRAGIESLQQSDAQAAILLLCDQPLLSADLLRQMAQRHRDGAPIVVCEYAGTWGAPMLFGRALWPELQVLEGDRGAQKVARAHPEIVSVLLFEDGAFDIDTADDYRNLLAHPGRGAS